MTDGQDAAAPGSDDAHNQNEPEGGQPPAPASPTDIDKLDAAQLEAFARRLGWRSPEEWARAPAHRRPPEMLTAKAFVVKTMTEAPLLRNRLRGQDDEIVELKGKVDEFGRKIDAQGNLIKQLHESHKTVRERSYKQARDDLEREMDAAANTGDPETYRDRKGRIAKLDQDHASEGAPAATNGHAAPVAHVPQPQPDPQVAAVVDPWAIRHPWFKQVPALNDEALRYEAGLDQSIPLAERLELTSDWIEETFGQVPHYQRFFPHLRRADAAPPAPQQQAPSAPAAPPRNPRRTGAPAVAAPSGAGAGGRAPAGLTYESLTPEEKAACDELCTTVKGFTREDYLKEYKR